MPSELKFIALGLSLLLTALVVCLEETQAAGICTNLMNGIVSEAVHEINELQTPYLAYSEFLSLIATRETARDTIESVEWVDSNFAGNFLEVKLKHNRTCYRVYKPSNSSDSLCERLKSYGIPVGFHWACR